MKTEDLQAQGLNDEQIKFVMAENGKDINSAKHKLEVERDNYKDSLDIAQNALKEFEGVDVKELNGRIAKLTKDFETKESEFNAKIADMEFNNALEAQLSESKARDNVAVKAFLDVETLKASKNRQEDIKAAIGKIKSEKDYLFVSDEPIQNPVGRTDGAKPGGGKKMTVSEIMKYKNEHPDADVSALMTQKE